MKRITSVSSRPAGRRGVTLSEVLVSTFVMSIGVVSVATLFPISMLRSVQATQATNATLLRQNAAALLSFDTALVHDPDRDSDFSEHAGTTFLIDPLGRADSLGALGTMLRFSGVANNNIPSIPVMERLAMLPDTWQPILTSPVQGLDNTNFLVTVPTTTDVSGLAGQMRTASSPTLPRYRMILTDATGKKNAIKDLFQVNTGSYQLSWRDSAGPTPATLPFTPVRVKVEAQERRYTCMFTVRKEGKGLVAGVDVVTFFNRSLSPADEFVYSGTYSINVRTGVSTSTGFDGAPGIEGVDDDGDFTTDETDGSELGWPGSDDNRTIDVSWNSSADPIPFVKNGGFVLDASSGQWYRIVQYTENQSAGTARIVVDRDLVPLPGTSTPQLVFFRGVLEVYPLGMRMTQ